MSTDQLTIVGWREVPFAQLLVEPVRNGVYKRKEFHGTGAKIVNMGELFAYPRLRDVCMRRIQLSDSEQHRLNVEVGDLLFARRSLVAEGAGKCSVVLEVNEPTAFESSLIRARPDPIKADSLFLYYYFNSPHGLHALDSIRRQVAVAGITGSDLAQLDIPLPPLPEQRAIAHILGTLDDKIELNRRMNQTLEAMARAIFKDWFVDFGPTRAKMEGLDPYLPPELWDLFPDELVDSELGGIPRGWNIKKLGEICTLRAGSTFPKAKQGSRLGTYPFAKVSDMNLAGNSLAILKAANWVGDEDLPQLKAKPLPEGTTVFAKIGEALKQNRLRITLQPTLIDNNMMGAIPDTEVIDHITLFRSLSRFDFGELSVGTALPYLTQKDLSALMIPLPPTDGQRIMSRHIQTLHEKAITNEREAISLLDIRDMLLPKLISGKLLVGPGPRNANWRPQQPPSFSGSILTPTWRQKNGK